jgi:hypothetical protein
MTDENQEWQEPTEHQKQIQVERVGSEIPYYAIRLVITHKEDGIGSSFLLTEEQATILKDVLDRSLDEMNSDVETRLRAVEERTSNERGYQ